MGLYTATAKTWGAEPLKSSDLNANVRDFINSFGATTSYTTTWAGFSANPTIGNGSIVAQYSQIQKMVYFRISINFGTTTNFGTGAYTLTLPVLPVANAGRVHYPGWLGNTNVYLIHGQTNGSTTTMQLYYVNSTTGTAQVNNVSASAPVGLTAAAGNGIYVSGWYEAA